MITGIESALNPDLYRFDPCYQDRPACPPLHHFSRIPNLYFQYGKVSRKFLKKISGTGVEPVPEKKEHELAAIL